MKLSLISRTTRSLTAWGARNRSDSIPPVGPRIGLALSCGGARGLAHVGVIQVLEENRIPVDIIAGSSMGAYVGSLWAAGFNGSDLEKFASEMGRPRALWHRLDLALPPVQGLFKGNGIRARLAESLKGATFRSLRKELRVIAANVDTLERHVFRTGDVATAVHASFAIPGICVPVEINGTRYVDGGVVDPLPVGILRGERCDIVIAVSVIPTLAELEVGHTSLRSAPVHGYVRRFLAYLNRSWNVFARGNVIDTMRRALAASEIRMVQTSARRADVLIRPVMPHPFWHDYHHYEDYIALGRRAAEAALPAIQALLTQHQRKGDRHETARY